MAHCFAKNAKRLFWTGVILLSAVQSFAKGPADPEVEALLANMRQAYAAVRSARIQTVAVARRIDSQRLQSRLRVFETDILYRRPDIIRAYVSSAGELLGNITIDGYRRVLLNGKQQRVTNNFVFFVDMLQRQINLESICFWDWTRQLSTDPGKNMSSSTFALTHNVPWNGKSWLVLQETARDADQVIDYYIDPKTYFVWRTYTVAISTRKEQQETKLKSLVINDPITDAELRHYEARQPKPRPPVMFAP